ncbi:hypothetical protein CEB3_c19010 [Peptococcaceae bacterium CEB3]|nr:hypothetical protein CEB3_c19010 [Peptococcaceae bacterium CEB3]
MHLPRLSKQKAVQTSKIFGKDDSECVNVGPVTARPVNVLSVQTRAAFISSMICAVNERCCAVNRKRVMVTVLAVFVILLTLTVVPKTGYRVYKSDGSIITLVPSKQHPLIFFATWCPHCQQDLANKINPNAYYIDTFTREPNPKASFAAVRNFVKVYHADPDLSRYFVSVDKQPRGVPHVPFIEKGVF